MAKTMGPERCRTVSPPARRPQRGRGQKKTVLRIMNLTRQTVLLDEAAVADTFFRRLKGLLGCQALRPGHGLVLKPCRSVHTWGMRFAIDVAFVDRRNVICRLLPRLRPYCCSPRVREAVCVIEAPAGTFERTGTRQGDLVLLEPLL